MPVDVVRLQDPVANVEELLKVRARWAAEQDRQPRPNDTYVIDFTEWLGREVAHREFWLARVDGEAVGMVNLLMFERMPTVGGPAGGWGYLCNMFVDATHRNLGIGAQLAESLLNFADAQGLERVVLKPSERSRPFYAALGFAHADNLLLVRQRSDNHSP